MQCPAFKPKPGRIYCLVPFCGHTTRGDDTQEWICGEHWRPISRDLKRAWATARRRGQHDRREWLWRFIRVKAIEIGMGIAA